MTIEIEVEFPVVTRAFSRGGGSKLVMGTVDLTARIPELEEAAVPVAARVHSGVIDDEFREFLREAWDERPVSLQVGFSGRCCGSRIA